jgi:hypothetical protein
VREALAVSRALCIWLSLSACSGQIGAPEDDPFTDPAGPGTLTLLEPLARRLTPEEYAQTVQQVTGVALDTADLARLPADRPLEGFVNIASGQTVLPDHVRAYAELARLVVADPAFETFVAAHAGCADVGDECAERTVAGIGARLFRRPPTDREQDAFSALFAAVAAEEVGFAGASAAVAEAMLQSPAFLYLLQEEKEGDGGERTLRGYEMASRLSYALWGSPPDDALYEAAARGDLDDAEGVADALEAMVSDARGARTTRRFLLDWARLESLPDDDGLRAELLESATRFYQDHVERGESLFDLFDVQRAALTPALARAYGLEPAGEGVRLYDLEAAEGRAGILAQPGVVAGMTNADGGEIVARGLFLQRQVFCGAPPDVPDELQDAIDAFVAEQPEDASAREIAETRLTRPECSACHSQFDPLAYGLERFDFRGAFRHEDEHGNALRDDGWIPAAYDADRRETPYADFDALVTILAGHPRVQLCLTQRHMEQLVGARLGREQLVAVVEITEALRAAGGRREALLRALVAHDLFRKQRIPE